MNKDKRTLYAITLAIIAVLSVLLFVNVKHSRILAAILLIPLAVITVFFIKRRRAFSLNKKEVLLLATVLAVLYATLTEMTGLYFTYYKNPYFISLKVLVERVLPLAAIIVSVELIRMVLLSQKSKLVDFLSFLIGILAEILAFSSLAGITNFNYFMDLVGLTLFPAFTANLYYHYVSKRYGAWPNIAFRLITTLYTYFIPTVTGMADSLTACIKLLLPIVMLALTAALFEKKTRVVRKGSKKLAAVATVLTAAIVLSIAMLISCQFRFGALVIATESMTGEINKGDMILYERYEGQPIEEGQVIVFTEPDSESRIVHRVVKVVTLGNETRYFTKGDANEDLDSGYRVAEDIVGLTDIKLAFVGYPTLWLREIINH